MEIIDQHPLALKLEQKAGVEAEALPLFLIPANNNLIVETQIDVLQTL